MVNRLPKPFKGAHVLHAAGLAAILSFGGTNELHAGLEWEQKTIRQNAALVDSKATVVFPFKKTVTLKIEAEAGAEILSITSTDPRFEVTHQAVLDRREHLISITPTLRPETEKGMTMVKAVITIKTDLPPSSKSTFHAYTFIKR